MRDYYHHNYDCSPRNMSSCDCSSRDRCCIENTCGCYGGHEGHQDNLSMSKRHHHRPCNYDCSPRNMSSCDCSSRDRCCSTNTCGCYGGHEGHQDNLSMSKRHHHRPCNYDCSPRNMSSCDCSKDTCSSKYLWLW